jgi:poly-gamma-glutamate capsule biosynthesis protein CapA/YwtB (metallophosphatase superfamily)
MTPHVATQERTMRLALAGDAIERSRRPPLAPEVVAVAREADLFVLNLECCISARGERWPDPRKPFFFRAPPLAAELLAEMGVDCVTLANNHALDYGPEALLDTLEHLQRAGVAAAGAGTEASAAHNACVLGAGGMTVAVLGVSDHPPEYAAGPARCGIAYAENTAASWLTQAIAAARASADAVLVTPHWGPNMTARPPRYIRNAARRLLSAGATLVAGHSAHVFHGAAPRVLFDLGDFVDDYAVHPELRNDLGLLFLVELEPSGPREVEAVPLKLDHCYTRLARGDDAAWIRRRFIAACDELGTVAVERGDRVVASLGDPPPA